MDQSTAHAPLSDDVFFDRYRPVPAPGTTQENGEYTHEYDQVRDKDARFVWTLVDGDDDGIYVQAGFHVVNRIAYLVTEVPWTNGDEEAIWFDPADFSDE